MRLLVLISILIVTSYSGSEVLSLSSDSFQFIRQPDTDREGKGSIKYKLAPSEELVQGLVDDVVRNKFCQDDDLNGLVRDIQIQLRERRYRKPSQDLSSDDGLSATDEQSQSTTDSSWLDRGLDYIKGLLGGDTNSNDDTGGDNDTDTNSPSPDDQSIIEDIEKYLDHVIDNKNGTLEQILRYVARYVHKNVHFWLFTKNHNGYEDLTFGRASNISVSDFNKKKKTVIIIHGWINAGDNYYSQHMIDAFDQFGDFNIISVDWSELSYSFYTLSRISVNFVGPYVSKMIQFLAKNHDMRLADLHILGHSLGAHIAGIAGMFIKQGKVGRITGFDPASPLFGDSQKYRLDKSDAKFVDVIHTSILGMSDQLGHADFYPNGGGPSQPGCGLDIAVCPHRRSYLYFISSMKYNNFLSFPCDSWEGFSVGNCTSHYSHMGIRLTRRSRGKYYLRTSGQPPYALGMKTLDFYQPSPDYDS